VSTKTTSAPRDVVTIDVVNPATEGVVASVPTASAADCDLAVRTALTAQREWARLTGEQRGLRLWAWADLVEGAFAEIARLDVSCTGKVLRDAMGESHRSARHARYWAGHADKLFGRQLADGPDRLSFTRLEPLGVLVVVLPWNAPAHSFMARAAPALACGNAVIVKPSELSPLSAVRLAELALEAGLPAGLLQVVTGDGVTGESLCSDPRVGGVSFTGSVATGRRVAHAAADTFTKVTLEMGGKSPIVVFDDADLDAAARAAVFGILVNAGQICAGSSRLLVHRDIAETFTAEVAERMARVTVGDPSTGGTLMGPVVSRTQYDRVMGFLEAARSSGARTVLGGGRPASVGETGYYVAPTLLDGVDADDPVVHEEVFGPVLTVLPFATEAEAVQLANATDYGLSSYVWTRDVGRMLRMTEAIEAGVVHGNSPLVMDSQLPFGGFKSSGLGGAYGDEAIAGCTRTKRVTLRFAEEPFVTHWPGI
jgi:acyl-CoA reductase-like NAD-dependent aldehyde dehydrogenase